MVNEPAAAEGQQKRLTLVEAGQALNIWLAANRPDVKNHTDLARLLVKEGVLPECKSSGKALPMSLGNLRRGNWTKKNRCPRETAVKVFKWMGMEESQIPQPYLDPPRAPTPRLTEAQFPYSRTVNMSASEVLALHLKEAGGEYAVALRDCQSMLIEIGARLGGLRDLTFAVIERDIQTANFLSRSGTDPSNPIELGSSGQTPVVETPSCDVLVLQFQRTARAYVTALRESKLWLTKIAEERGKSGDQMAGAVEWQIKRVNVYWTYLKKHQKS